MANVESAPGFDLHSVNDLFFSRVVGGCSAALNMGIYVTCPRQISFA